ncbi:MAG: glycoside hydrolase family 2 protein [Eggerthella lenta]
MQPDELLWYRRPFAVPDGMDVEGDRRLVVHFEAVDYACACYVNRVRVGEHVGGYLPFAFDVTDALVSGENELSICVWDPSDAGVQLRGKQRLKRGGIWYTAQSGIWQSVWLEAVPEARIERLAVDASVEGRLTLRAVVRGAAVDEHGARRLFLNHEPLFLRGVLDQGYWPDGLMTAPSDEALAFDVRSMKDLGFNLLRKHIKVESDRWYYHCDRLGMLVWQDMVSGGAAPSPWHSSYKPTFFRGSWGRYADDDPRHFPGLASDSAAFRAEWTEACEDTVRYLGNHPSIVTWVLFNEAWGQFDARRAVERVRAIDPSRPVDAVSGWYDQACGDFLSVHNYFRPLEVYRDEARPARAFVISEFGGSSCHLADHSSLATSYGYAACPDPASFRDAVHKTLAQADALEAEGLAGYVYTQLSDVEEETNGLLTYDRRVNKLADPAEEDAR